MLHGDMMSDLFNDWLDKKKKQNINNDVIKMDCLIDFLEHVKALLFKEFVANYDNLSDYLDENVKIIKDKLMFLLASVEKIEKITLDKEDIIEKFLDRLPLVDNMLKTDLDALFEGDPAAESKTEIILCYPGFSAIFVYRIANIFYELNVKILPRALSEYAHSKTGIDIHPGAKIGAYFFIDHGTGIVIGETTIIGEHVKIYQGVTLGALSLREGLKLKGSKRHPTIKDYVTIYSGASIFGGETIIGENSTIGSNAFITSSIGDNMLVTIQGQKKKHLKE